QPSDWPGTTSNAERPEAAQDQAPVGESIGTSTSTSTAPPSELLFAPQWAASLVSATGQPQASLGHSPLSYDMEVMTSPESAASYRSWDDGSRFVEGTWLLARHTWRAQLANDSRPPPPSYLMIRERQGWRFAAADSKGQRIPVNQGVCLGCHTQARADLVFGPPTSKARSSVPAAPGERHSAAAAEPKLPVATLTTEPR
ncbi:MAG TPA: hypothetical protein VIV60_09025, partial [Polyangiaceae bacterium]